MEIFPSHHNSKDSMAGDPTRNGWNIAAHAINSNWWLLKAIYLLARKSRGTFASVRVVTTGRRRSSMAGGGGGRRGIRRPIPFTRRLLLSTAAYFLESFIANFVAALKSSKTSTDYVKRNSLLYPVQSYDMVFTHRLIYILAERGRRGLCTAFDGVTRRREAARGCERRPLISKERLNRASLFLIWGFRSRFIAVILWRLPQLWIFIFEFEWYISVNNGTQAFERDAENCHVCWKPFVTCFERVLGYINFVVVSD